MGQVHTGPSQNVPIIDEVIRNWSGVQRSTDTVYVMRGGRNFRD